VRAHEEPYSFCPDGLESANGALLSELVINHWFWISKFLELGLRKGSERIMDRFSFEVLQLRNKVPDVVSVWISFLTLKQGVENSKVRRGVGAGRRDPLPPAIVGAEIAVDEVLHEVSLSQAPVQHQVLRQEHGCNHPRTVVHVPLRVTLPHSRVDDGISGFPVLPPLQDLAVHVLLPEYVCVLLLERSAHADARERSKDMCVEVTPSNLLDPDAQPRVATGPEFATLDLEESADALSSGDDSGGEVRAFESD